MIQDNIKKDIIKEVLEEKLNISVFLNEAAQESIITNIYNYCLSKRMYRESLANHLDQTIDFLQKLHFEQEEILAAINNSPSLIHANKQDMFAKYLILSVLDNTPLKSTRKELLVNRPKYYIIGIQTLYARYKFLSDKGSNYISKWYLLKMTNKEFEDCFGVSQESLTTMYPYDSNCILELLQLEGNEELEVKSEVYNV